MRKMFLNAIAGLLVKEYRLDEIMEYVLKMKNLEKEVTSLKDEIDFMKARLINLEKEK
tara:strand:- start:172 stop:345 length:174 start_codon:yes stop_codon:yes gene_type:complete